MSRAARGGILLLLLPAWRRRPLIAAGQLAGWASGVGITLLVNWARFGSPLQFGYGGSVAWSTPIWIGVTRVTLGITSPPRSTSTQSPILTPNRSISSIL